MYYKLRGVKRINKIYKKARLTVLSRYLIKHGNFVSWLSWETMLS